MIGWLLLFALAVGGISYGAYTYARSRAYFAIEGNSVTAYQGVPGAFGGVKLTWPLGDTGIRFDALPTDLQARLKDGVDFSFDDLAKMESLYASRQATSSPSPPPSAVTSSSPTSSTVQ